MPRLGHIQLVAALAAGAFLAAPPPAHAAGRPAVAALQVTLRHHHVYRGPVDGVIGPGTTSAVVRFQRRHGLTPDGVAGPKTRRAFGRFARHVLGSRPLAPRMAGWDVAELQFALAWHGFPNGTIDGGFGGHTERALIKFQRWAHLTPDGVAGPGTFRALRAPLPLCPITLAWPLQAPIGSPFGPRGTGFHPGIDLPARPGTPVGAAAPGRVFFAAYDGSGYGNLVEVAHGGGVVSMYAHLSRVSVRVGQSVATGARVGRVGSTGEATGSHLHFEVRVRGGAVDPVPALP
jgi:peptidoglycan hydrolase-like protein with peptidoglycan-binding domain